jgi:NADH dehydrogenase [ubiquinone] 1 alpha subcomplex assembly factor 7
MPKETNQLHKKIANAIRKHGPMSVAEYMSLAAEAYYKTQNPFGAAGDFTTAPEISQMFGELIGIWFADIWMKMGQPAVVKLIELGPGRGMLAADIMRTIGGWPEFRTAVTLHLVETSPRLREIQADVLKDYQPQWYDRVQDVPEGFCLVVANEFFDALPVQQFVKTEQGLQERFVGYDEAKDAFFFSHPAENIFETSPLSQTITRQISTRIADHGGAALIVDYGHAEPGLGETLQALTKHQYANALENPGEYDITAHVDFSALKKAAEGYVDVVGPTTQGEFLRGLGIAARAQVLYEKATEAQRQDIMSALKRLTAEKEMGRLFKVMALIPKEAKIEVAGFSLLSS